MKKVLMFLFSLVLVVTLVACGAEVTVSIDASTTNLKVGDTVQLNVTVEGSEDQSVTFSTNKNGIVSITDTGLVTALKNGTVVVTAKANADETKSAVITLKVKNAGGGDSIDLGGYEIVVAYSPNSLYEMDPRLPYAGSGNPSPDRPYRQQAFEWVESEFNCKITITPYPCDRDEDRWPYINQQATNGVTDFDIYWVPTKYLSIMSAGFIDMEDFYQSVAPGTLSDSDYMARVVKEQLKGWSYSSNSITSDDPVLGVNINLLKQIGMEDKEPAKMYQQDKWNFEDFAAWVREMQTALDSQFPDDKHYVLTGMLNDYVVNMSRASGVAICDPLSGKINLETEIPGKAAKLLRDLLAEGCVDPANSPDAQSDAWNTGKALICYGTSYWVGYKDRWRADLWDEGGNSEFAYAPFPYNVGLHSPYCEEEGVKYNRFATYTQDTFTMPLAINYKIEQSGIDSDDLTPMNIFRAWYMTYQKTKDLIAADTALGLYSEDEARRAEAENKWATPASVEVWIKNGERLRDDPTVAIFDPINELDNHWSSEYAEAVAGFISPDLGYTQATDYGSAVHPFVQDLEQKFTAKYK